MGCLKCLCYASAGLHFILTLLLALGSILICIYYNEPQKLSTNYDIQDTAFWLWVILAIYCVFAFVSTIVLMRGIAVEKPSLIKPFFSNMIAIMIFITIRALVVMVKQIQHNYSASVVASEFFTEISICIFSGIVMVPCFILFKKVAGKSYFQCIYDCCPWLECCKDKHRPTRVPNYQV